MEELEAYKNMKNKTLDYYNHHAQSFISITVSVNFKQVQDKFIHALNGSKVLDFGCGSGRDTKYFLESGLQVTAVDGSEEICRYEYYGAAEPPVRCGEPRNNPPIGPGRHSG